MNGTKQATTRRKPRRRQAVRRVLLMLSFIAFPVTIFYFSPYLIVMGAFSGIVSGSLVVFGALFVGSLLFGRLWCGWACPAGALQEPLLVVNGGRVGRRAGLVKWIIWVPWVTAIVAGAVSAGGFHSIDPFLGTTGGISVAGSADSPVLAAYAIYFIVVLLFFGLAVVQGRRGGCHAVCWMAPFMIAGRALRNRLGAWPSLRLKADPAACTDCGACTRACPMGIDVDELARKGSMEHHECILCGSCVDGCPRSVIRFSFSRGL